MRPIESAPAGDSISFRQVLAVLRRRYQLILAMTLIGASIGLFLASQAPATYQAAAMLRLAGERQTLTGDEEEAPGLGKTADPTPVHHRVAEEPDGGAGRRGHAGPPARRAGLPSSRSRASRRCTSILGPPATPCSSSSTRTISRHAAPIGR